MNSNAIFTLGLITILGYSFSMNSEAQAAAPEPILPVPSDVQLHWQKNEMLMFVHFGIKTFYPSNNHMGSGKEDPNKFDPVKFDAKQWVKAAQAGGFKGIVLTTKHHDGFCNWQTATTDHSLKSSKWRDGKGDVVKDLADACHEADILFGLYFTIWDRNYEVSGGDKSKYSEFYQAQLTELLTKYGKVDELWFDGFGAKNMKVDFKKVSEIVMKHQPKALVYDSGTMVKYIPESCARWPGRHGGLKEPMWSFIEKGKNKSGWYPIEASLIAQGNWFYNNKPIVSLSKLQEYYRSTVGINAVALINVAPNRDGLIDDASVVRMKEFKSWIDGLYANDLARGKNVKISADSTRGNSKKFAAKNMIDGNYDTYFATDDGVKTASIEIDLGQPMDIRGVILQEYIPLGQRVSKYAVECFDGKQWVRMAEANTIGFKKIILEKSKQAGGKAFPKTERVRLVILDSRAAPTISTFSVIGPEK